MLHWAVTPHRAAYSLAHFCKRIRLGVGGRKRKKKVDQQHYAEENKENTDNTSYSGLFEYLVTVATIKPEEE